MKIAITGATGQLGRLVIDQLKNKVAKDDILALVRSPKKAEELGVAAREFDYNQAETLEAALIGVDKLLLISGNEVGQREKQHLAVISAAKKAGVKYIVYTSFLRTDVSTLVLAPEHFATENAIKNSGIAYTILRNGWYTENYTSSLKSALAHGAVIGAAGEGKISSATRKDYAEAAALVLTSGGHENKTYELAGDQAFTMKEYAEEISKITGKTVPYVNLSVEDYATALIKAGLPEGMANFFAGFDIAIEKGDLFDDNRQLSKLIGRATTSLNIAIQEAL